MAGQSAFEAVKFSRAAKAKRRRRYPGTRRSLAIDFLVPLRPAGLLALRQTLVRRCLVAGVHPGLPRIGKSGHDVGASGFGAGEVFRGSKQSTAVLTLVPAVHWQSTS
jgi:hypothetical protein